MRKGILLAITMVKPIIGCSTSIYWSEVFYHSYHTLSQAIETTLVILSQLGDTIFLLDGPNPAQSHTACNYYGGNILML